MRDTRFYALQNIVEVVELETCFIPRARFEKMDLLIERSVAVDNEGQAWSYRVPYKKNPGADDSDYRLGSWARDKIPIEHYNDCAKKGEVVIIDSIFPRKKSVSKGPRKFILSPELGLEPTCECGAKMRARENPRTKKLFWGCSEYPSCKRTQKMSSIMQKRVRAWSQD